MADEAIHQADEPIWHNQSVIMTVIIYTQDHSDATRGNQRQSEAITCNHVHSEAIRGNHVQSRAITSTQRQSADPLITALHTAKRSRCFASFEM